MFLPRYFIYLRDLNYVDRLLLEKQDRLFLGIWAIPTVGYAYADRIN